MEHPDAEFIQSAAEAMANDMGAHGGLEPVSVGSSAYKDMLREYSDGYQVPWGPLDDAVRAIMRERAGL